MVTFCHDYALPCDKNVRQLQLAQSLPLPLCLTRKAGCGKQYLSNQ